MCSSSESPARSSEISTTRLRQAQRKRKIDIVIRLPRGNCFQRGRAPPMAHPQLTKPILVDRWVPQPNFSDAKHQVDPATQKPLECNVCHQATQSRETSDLLMRRKRTGSLVTLIARRLPRRQSLNRQAQLKKCSSVKGRPFERLT